MKKLFFIGFLFLFTLFIPFSNARAWLNVCNYSNEAVYTSLVHWDTKTATWVCENIDYLIQHGECKLVWTESVMKNQVYLSVYSFKTEFNKPTAQFCCGFGKDEGLILYGAGKKDICIKENRKIRTFEYAGDVDERTYYVLPK
jgi:hypothetical protein